MNKGNWKWKVEPNEIRSTDGEDTVFAEAKAFAASICLIRRAQGKSNPADFEVGSEAWRISIQDFAVDVLRLPLEELTRFAPIVRKLSNKNLD